MTVGVVTQLENDASLRIILKIIIQSPGLASNY